MTIAVVGAATTPAVQPPARITWYVADVTDRTAECGTPYYRGRMGVWCMIGIIHESVGVALGSRVGERRWRVDTVAAVSANVRAQRSRAEFGPARGHLALPGSLSPTDDPNPCLGETYEEIWWFDGHLLIHEFTNPSGNTHYNDVGYIAAETESGFAMPEKMIGVDVENISDNTVTFTGTGLYQLRNDDNEKLRLQLKIQTTVVDGDVKVDLFNLDIACLGN